jgi:serine protease Do
MNTLPDAERNMANGPLALAVVYLTGRRSGTAVWPQGDYLRVGTFPGAEIPLTRQAGEVPPEEYGFIRRVGREFELDTAPGKEILVNGEPSDQHLLVSGDILEIGRGGPVLRVRTYPVGASGKPLRDVLSDCIECARRSRRRWWSRWAAVARSLPGEILTQGAWSVRISALGAVAVVLGLGGLLGYRAVQLERQLQEARGRVAGLAELLARGRENPGTAEELARALEEMQTDVSETARRVRALEGQSAAARLVIAAAARSTVFIQGSWGFVDPQSGAPLRVVVGPGGAPVRGPGGEPLITTDERSPILEALFTGTGFVVSQDGLLLSNRHIARPWDFDDAAKRVAAQGWVPVMRRMIAYIPGVPDSLTLQLEAVSDSVDLALFRCTGPVRALPALPLAESVAQAGEEIIVLGYPLGMRALMARADAQFLAELRTAGNVDFWSLGARLARTGQVAPLASAGIVSQVTREAVVYDAETTSGGSGGPVLSLRGEVLAVTSAILPEFGGSNLGVPIARARALLRPPDLP